MSALLQMQDFHAGYGPIEVLRGLTIEVGPGDGSAEAGGAQVL